MPLPILLQNSLACVASFVGASTWTEILIRLSKSRFLSAPVTRKVMHITTAPLFTLTWPLYVHHVPNVSARLLAACVPLTFGLRILRKPKDSKLANQVARESQKRANVKPLSIVSGPLAYAISISIIAGLTWTSPHTFLAFSALCFGDGMADVVGTAFNARPLPLNPKSFFKKKKTIPGSVACFLSTVLAATVWQRLPFIFFDPRDAQSRLDNPIATLPLTHITKVAAVATLAELLPFEDNYTVPFTAFLFSIATGKSFSSPIST